MKVHFFIHMVPTSMKLAKPFHLVYSETLEKA